MGAESAGRARATWDLTAVGDLCADLVLANPPGQPVAGRELLVEDARLALGGATAILAAAAARLGLRARLVGKVGDDVFGHFLLGELGRAGVNTDLVVIAPTERTAVTVALSRPDDRALLTYAGTIATFGPADLSPAALDDTRHLHLSSYFLQRALQPACADLFRRARARGITTSLDTGDDPDEGWEAGLADLLPATDYFFPNEREALGIAGATRADEAAARLAARSGGAVVVKRGAAGAYALVGGAALCQPAYRVAAVDTTGAGDVFDAGYLWGLLRGDSPRDCLRRAAAAGALATTWLGGQSDELRPDRVARLIAGDGGAAGGGASGGPDD